MRKFYFNEDGTINIVKATLSVVIILLLFSLLILFLFREREKLTEGGGTTSTNKILTTTIKLCKDCKMKFKQNEYKMEANAEIEISELLDLEKINVKMIKFTIEDKSLLEIKEINGKLMLKSLDKLGSTKLVATFDDREASLDVVINQTFAQSAKLYDKVYYAYLNQETLIDVDSKPIGIDPSFLDLSVENLNIATIMPNGHVKGLAIGETTIILNSPEGTSRALLYVIRNRITIKVKEGMLYKEIDYIKYPSNIDGYLDLSIKPENNLSKDDLKFQIENNGSLTASITYDGKNISDEGAYLYKVAIKVNESMSAIKNYSIIYITLPDGSKTRLEIEKEG